ncbi:hypothetical protein G6L37_06915 [Agrobacterium rubi]|nr:hypothetical protein [Agrobacterium rubi]NTF25096.1 hypothetical protein [Agrobacterium rubi]
MTSSIQAAPSVDDAITETISRVRLSTGCNEHASPRDVAFLLARLDALELGLGATREFIAQQPEDIFGYDEEGDPEIGVRTWAVRDHELWYIDQVLRGGLTLGGRRHADRYEAQFDVMVPEQEELVISFCNEIGAARDRGLSIDPVRLLEMAHALYQAEMDGSRRDTYQDDDKLNALRDLDRIMSGLGALPEGNWTYRANEFDDWGMVRNLGDDGSTIGFVANARAGLYELESQEALAAHREAKTDPYAPIGRHLAACKPAAIRRILALVRHLEAEVRRLTALDREYSQIEAWVLRNTQHNPRYRGTNGADRLMERLQSLKERAESADRRKLA